MTRLVLAVVLLTMLSACDEAPPPPPYALEYDDGVSAFERTLWLTAGAAWSGVVGQRMFVDSVEGDCGHVRIYHRPWKDRGTTYQIGCNFVIEYRTAGDKIMKLHELGHVLGLEHRPDSVMAGEGQPMAEELKPEDGVEVRAYWGMVDP
jgi:hypothetical protein